MPFIDGPNLLNRLHDSTVNNSHVKCLRFTSPSVVVRCFAAAGSTKDARSSGARGRRQRRATPDALGRGYPSDGEFLQVAHTQEERQAAPFRHRRNSRVLDLQEAWQLITGPRQALMAPGPRQAGVGEQAAGLDCRDRDRSMVERAGQTSEIGGRDALIRVYQAALACFHSMLAAMFNV